MYILTERNGGTLEQIKQILIMILISLQGQYSQLFYTNNETHCIDGLFNYFNRVN